MPAITKALRQPSSVPTWPNRNDSDAPIVKELVYHAAMRARVAPSTEWRGRTYEVLVLDGGFAWQGTHYRSLSALARKITGTAWSGPLFFGLKTNRSATLAAIGQADQRDDREHIAGRDNPREPAGLRVGQRPGLDELRQESRDNRESGQAENFGGAYGGNNRGRRCSRGGLSQTHGSNERTPAGEPGF